MKILIYQKFRNPEEDPLNIELHCWAVNAETLESALEVAEKSPYVPWRMYLVDKVESDKFDDWIAQNEVNKDDIFIHTLQ